MGSKSTSFWCCALWLAACSPGAGTGESTIVAEPPRIFFSDLAAGPNRGGQDNLGAFVTIYGRRFGAHQGGSVVEVGGGLVASYVSWSDTRILFQLGPAAATGDIVVVAGAERSNAIPFTVTSGKIHFVARGGQDRGEGTFQFPWATLPYAAQNMAGGDITYAMDGVSQTGDDGQGWDAALTLRAQWCDASAPRALVAYPGASVILGSLKGAPDSGIRSTGDSPSQPGCSGGWTFAGLQIRGLAAIGLDGVSNNWRFVANDITCPNGNGSAACMLTSRASNLKMFGNNVHDTGVATASSQYHGVYFSTDSNHIEMGWNTVANVHGCRGIQVHSTAESAGSGLNQFDLSFHDNLIHDTQCDGIVLYTVDPSKGKVEVYNNVIYNAGKGPNNPERTGNWACIYAAGATNAGTPGGGTIQVYGNTLYNCGSFAGPPYQYALAGVENAGKNAALKIELHDNIIYQLNANAPYILNGSDALDGAFGSNNLMFGIGRPPADSISGSFTNTVNTDPLFVNAAAADFHLSPESPARAAGTVTPQTADRDGVPFPPAGPHPIGAYLCVPSSIPPHPPEGGRRRDRVP